MFLNVVVQGPEFEKGLQISCHVAGLVGICNDAAQLCDLLQAQALKPLGNVEVLHCQNVLLMKFVCLMRFVLN